MNKLLITLPLLTLTCGAMAASDTVRKPPADPAAASAPHRAGKVAKVPNAAASANQAGVSPTAGGEQGKGPPRQMKKTEAESNSSQ